MVNSPCNSWVRYDASEVRRGTQHKATYVISARSDNGIIAIIGAVLKEAERGRFFSFGGLVSFFAGVVSFSLVVSLTASFSLCPCLCLWDLWCFFWGASTRVCDDWLFLRWPSNKMKLRIKINQNKFSEFKNIAATFLHLINPLSATDQTSRQKKLKHVATDEIVQSKMM